MTTLRIEGGIAGADCTDAPEPSAPRWQLVGMTLGQIIGDGGAVIRCGVADGALGLLLESVDGRVFYHLRGSMFEMMDAWGPA